MECSVDNWTKNFQSFPVAFYSEASITSYRIENDDNRTKSYTHGYRLFKSGNVMNVVLNYSENIVVKADVKAAFKSTLYNVVVFISVSGEVMKGSCNCIGGVQGRCKHVFALLWYILDCARQELPLIAEDVACTSAPRTWGTGSSKAHNVKPFEELQFVKHDPGKQSKSVLKHIQDRKIKRIRYEAVECSPEFLQRCHNNILKSGLNMLAECIEGNAFQASRHYFGDATNNEVRLPQNILWEHEYLEFCRNNNISQLKQDYCKISLSTAQELYDQTQLQSQSNLWYLERSKRLTASKFYFIISRQAAVTEEFVKTIFMKKCTYKTAAMKLGIENENAVVNKILTQNQNLKYSACGVCVNPGVPCLAATPDGILYNEVTKSYSLLEIKTLVKAMEQNCTVREAIARKLCNFLTFDNENIIVKQNHQYYLQVQGQLAITGLSRCDFVVDTGKDMVMIQISLDEHKWKVEWLHKLLKFYFAHFKFDS